MGQFWQATAVKSSSNLNYKEPLFMRRPSDQERAQALAEASRRVEQGDSPDMLATRLTELAEHCDRLDRVRELAEKVAREGVSESEHTGLLKALNNARTMPVSADSGQRAAALEAAQGLRDQGADADCLGHVALYLTEREDYLERVRQAAERYIRFGLDETEHDRLLKALDSARMAESREAGDDEELGLG